MDSRVESENGQALRLLAAIPGFSAASTKAARLTRLPGLTNRVYRVDLPQGSFALRVPGEGTAAIIDRRAEAANARAAAAAGIAPEVLYFGTEGVMLTRLIDDGEPLSPETIMARAGALERVGVVLRRLHDDVPAFASRLGPFATINAYRSVLEKRGIGLTVRQRAILDAAEGVRGALDATPVAFRSCHCDPTGRNLIDTGKRVWLVDWEYSGLNDPYWDLSYCSFQCALPEAADARLLAAYLGRSPEAAEAARMQVMKAPIELMSALWALVQHAHGNSAADFASYAGRVFEESAARLATPEFAAALKALPGR